MKVIIAGSRSIHAKELIPQVARYSGFTISEVVSGGAPGVDRLGEEFAKSFGIDLVIFPANWIRYHQSAGPIRNRKMAGYADALIAIWDGSSKGTQDMIKTMEALGKPVFIYKTESLQ